jgi:hypothetical protein
VSGEVREQLKSLPEEIQDTIEDVLTFYIDTTWDDYAHPYDDDEELDSAPFDNARQLYRDLTGFDRVNGANVLIDKPSGD